MPFQLLYYFRYQDDVTGETVRVNINDFESFDPGPITPTEFELDASKPAFRVSVIDNDRDKFTVFRAKAADITFRATNNLTANIFAQGADDKWYVEAFVESTNFYLFKGFLVMDDFQQDFQPVVQKFDVNLTATDNLGTLKEIPLTDFDGNYVRGKDTILNFICYALSKTGMQLNIVITTSWFEEFQTDFEAAWSNLYLDGKTFESKIGEAVDCYTALQIIFGYDCNIQQYNGKWWIGHIDEMYGSTVYRFEYDWEGTLVTNHTGAPFTQEIGKNELIKFVNRDALVNFFRPLKYVRLTYNYRLPIEIIDNIDFSRGLDDISPLAVDLSLYISTHANLGAFPATGQHDLTYKATDTGNYYRWIGTGYEQITGAEVPSGTAYVWEDWTVGRVSGSPSQTPHIVKIRQYGEEKARYAVFSASSGAQHSMTANPLSIGRGDKFIVSVDKRFNADLSGAGTTTEDVMMIKLVGVDGSDWTVNPDGSWNTSSLQTVNHQYQLNATDQREWMNVSVDVRPAPVSGELFVTLYQSPTHGNTYETHYSNLQFDYQPFINGSYQKFTGHSNKVEQSGNYKANIDDEVFLGDSPRPAFKGTMFKQISGEFVPTARWYKGGDLLNQGITPPIPDAHLKPFGYWQIFALWNQYRRMMLGFSGTLKGLRLDGANVPDMVHSYFLSDSTSEINTENKTFNLISMGDVDPETNEWTATLIETWDSDLPKSYSDTHTFKFEGGAP